MSHILTLCQDSSNFYLIMGQGGNYNDFWQLKRINSETGPNGTALSDAIRSQYSVPGQTQVLWSSSPPGRITSLMLAVLSLILGWDHNIAYRFDILHNPDENLIRVKIWEGEALVVDTGDIRDEGGASLKGGRLGVYCDSQEDITWSALSYRCVSKLSKFRVRSPVKLSPRRFKPNSQ